MGIFNREASLGHCCIQGFKCSGCSKRDGTVWPRGVERKMLCGDCGKLVIEESYPGETIPVVMGVVRK
jgi:hypothetical protein